MRMWSSCEIDIISAPLLHYEVSVALECRPSWIVLRALPHQKMQDHVFKMILTLKRSWRHGSFK